MTNSKAEAMALKLQARAAVRSLQLFVQMAERGGIDGVRDELAQIVDLAERVATLKAAAQN
jgi:hypothetical protein